MSRFAYKFGYKVLDQDDNLLDEDFVLVGLTKDMLLKERHRYKDCALKSKYLLAYPGIYNEVYEEVCKKVNVSKYRSNNNVLISPCDDMPFDLIKDFINL